MADPKSTPDRAQSSTPVPGPFDLSPDIAAKHPTGCGPGETSADRDRRLQRR